MGLLQHSGSFVKPSSDQLEPYSAPPETTKYIDGNRYHLPNDGTLTNDKVVKDTLLNQTAWNVDRWADSVCLIAGYSDGFPIEVTYFNQETGLGDFRNNPADVVLGTDHTIHKNLIKINNMELRLIGALDYSFDSAENRMTAVGQCYTHMGFKPVIGDIFYMLLNDGKWGIMAIRSVERLSISQATLHKCDIELVQYLTAATRDYFDQCVVDIRYFDKQKYLTANMTLLSTESYIQLADIRQLRKEIVSRYGDTFLDNLTHSFIRPDNLYDPYVVEFWHLKVSVTEYPVRPQQLFPELSDYHKSIWSCFTDSNRYNGPKDADHFIRAVTRHNNYWQTGITPLIDREYIALGTVVDPRSRTEHDLEGTYIFSKGFYLEDTSQMTTPEQMVYEVLCGVVPVNKIIDYVKGYRSWNKETAFYWIPISIWLLDKAYLVVTD